MNDAGVSSVWLAVEGVQPGTKEEACCLAIEPTVQLNQPGTYDVVAHATTDDGARSRDTPASG